MVLREDEAAVAAESHELEAVVVLGSFGEWEGGL